MPVNIRNELASKELVLSGVSLAARTASLTMGPMGRYVLAERDYGTPVLRDAVSAVRPIESSDQLVNLGLKFTRAVAVQTSDEVGDGSATAIVLFHALLKESMKQVASGADSTRLSASLRTLTEVIIQELYENAIFLEEPRHLEKLATRAAGGDSAAGKIVSDAIHAAGEGTVIAKVSSHSETSLVITSGSRFDLIPISSTLALEDGRIDSVLFNPIVCLYDGTINEFEDLIPILEAGIQDKSILFIAREITGEALQGLHLNRREGSAKIFALKPKPSSHEAETILEDISAVLSIPVLGGSHPWDFNSVNPEQLKTTAEIEKVSGCILISNRGVFGEHLVGHIADLKRQYVSASVNKDILRERLSRLEGKNAVIEVGGFTETETKETRDRISTALHAVKLAISGGVVAGGGAALTRISSEIANRLDSSDSDKLAAICLKNALSTPLRCIVHNSYRESGPIIQKISTSPDSLVFDTLSGEYLSQRDADLYDPVEVIVTGLKIAVGMATALLNTAVIIQNAGSAS